MHRYDYPGNWKLQLDNGVDGYHGNYAHESFMKLLERAGEATLQRVVAALGGELDMIVRFPKGSIRIEQFDKVKTRRPARRQIPLRARAS